MRKKLGFLAIFMISSFWLFANEHGRAILRGKVVDAANNQPLAGAVVYLSDLKTATSTNLEGDFMFADLPANGKFVLEVRYMGYSGYSIEVDLSRTKSVLIRLEERVIESREVVITGTPFGTNQKTSSLAISSLQQQDLVRMGAPNLVDAVAKLPGVSSVATGTAIAKPIIRGLGYNRVLTLIDGVREEGQQWGDEHGLLVDENAAARVEVLKGPASLLYGSDALGGVINILDDIAPAPGLSDGRFNVGYQTNAGLFSSSLMWQGNDNGFTYRGRVSYKNAYGFSVPGNIVPNSGMQENAVSASIGLRKPWGYSNLSISRLSSDLGLVEEGPDTDGLFNDADGVLISKEQAKRRSFDLPFQRITHYRLAWRSNLVIADGQLKSDFGFQRNLRGEYEENFNKPGLDLALDSYTYDVKYAFPTNNNWERNMGVQGMFQQNTNHGDEFLIPNYQLFTLGGFVYLKKKMGDVAFNAGFRYDYSEIQGDDLIVVENGVNQLHFTAFNNSFYNLSGAVGLTWKLDEKLRFRANVGSGFRAPNIAELASNGKHEGTFRYEIGNSQLKQETSLQLDLGLNFDLENVSFEINGFHNTIYRYIYLHQQNAEQITVTNHDGNVEVLPVYRYDQTNARLLGGELVADVHWIKNLHWESTFAYVKGVNLADRQALPFIPAVNWRNELRFEPAIKGLQASYVKVGLNHFFAQNRIAAFETPTKGYCLLEAGIGTSIPLGKQKFNVWLSGQNLANVSYFNHLSRYKLAGIHNPGRNLAFGLMIPL